MNKKAVFLTGVFALTLVALLTASVEPSKWIEVPKDSGDIAVQQTGQEVHELLGGTSPTMNLIVEKGYGHVRIKVQNRGKSDLTWSLQSNGKEYIFKTVGKGDTLTWRSVDSFPNGMPQGKYVVQFRANGNEVRGDAWGTTGQYTGDIS
ncbi:hypothetical protein [Paenibacillus polymyxa]|uniref:hypothetical protein n=1 Tax=Paenibacillus polymyxa TaxID=1406 RepID=UPI00287F726B|nr:hypothetical protein [Paenibacillus polymyxa]